MADGWRPLVVSGIVVAVIVGTANRNDDGPPSADRESAPVAESRAEQTEVLEPPTEVPTGSPAGSSTAPVAAVDDLGTRRLAGVDDGPAVALTFDDGPHPRHTEQVLSVLRDKEVTATFCLVGQQAATYPELVRAIVHDGHVVCNHTVTHDMSLRFKRSTVIADEFDDTTSAILAAAPDADIRFFRAPGGYFAENLNAAAADRGLTPLGWSIDSNDWRKPGSAAIRDAVLTHAHPDAIVLLHDGGGDRSQTVDALPQIIDGLAEQGYEFVVPAS